MSDTKTTLTLKDQHGEYSVSVSKTDMDIFEIMDQLVKPLLIASTFSAKTINDYFGEEE